MTVPFQKKQHALFTMTAGVLVFFGVLASGCDTETRTLIFPPVGGSIPSCTENPNAPLCTNPSALPACALGAQLQSLTLNNNTSSQCTFSAALYQPTDSTCSNQPICTATCTVPADSSGIALASFFNDKTNCIISEECKNNKNIKIDESYLTATGSCP